LPFNLAWLIIFGSFISQFLNSYVHPTGGSRRVFGQFAWLEAGPGKAALSRPAHPRVTHTVGQIRNVMIPTYRRLH
jgi:hypothetical protein